MTDNSYTSSKLIKYAIDYLSKYSSSKANLEKILRNKIQRLKIEKKEKYLLYNSLEKIIFDLEEKIQSICKSYSLNNSKQEYNLIESLKINCRKTVKEKTGKRPYTNVNLIRI